VTGSKGKSTTSSAIHYGLLGDYPRARLGGNITISPLSFLDELQADDPLVLELSSFQLGDLYRSWSYQQQGRLRAFPPQIAVITSMFHDHQDYYGAMEPYLADKAVLYKDQKASDYVLFRTDDPWSQAMSQQAQAQVALIEPRKGHVAAGNLGAYFDEHGQGWFKHGDESTLLLGRDIAIRGEHSRSNLLQAALALALFGVPVEHISERLASFPGIEHRLEPCGTMGNLHFINDSAATIPEAALAAVKSLDSPVHLITGGTDKQLDFSIFKQTASLAASVTLLKGTASDAIAQLFSNHGIGYYGPYDNLEAAVRHALKLANGQGNLVLSPGCASFGMFLNEFDRGRQFKAIVARLIQEHTAH
jgi:UDP-N-acetylmuramoylalanine--D-glutamate ligase